MGELQNLYQIQSQDPKRWMHNNCEVTQYQWPWALGWMRGKNGVELISDRTLDTSSGSDGEAEDPFAVIMEW